MEVPSSLPPASTLAATQPATQSAGLPAPAGSPSPAVPPYTDPEDLRRGLALRLGSPEWTRLGLPAGLTQRAQAFVQAGQPLAQGDGQVLALVLAQWDSLEAAARHRLVPPPASLVVQAYLPAQASTPVLYARRGEANAPAAKQPIFLPIQPAAGEAAAGVTLGLAQAPVLQGFTQQISQDGRAVAYLDAEARVVVSVTMQVAGDGDIKQKTLLDQLVKLYGADDPYARARVFPRFRFPVDGIEASFYGLDRSLSSTQVVLLRETFLVYDRPAFEPLKSAMFGPGIAIVTMDRLKDAAGLNYSGTGIIVLVRRDLFGNKYQLAQVLAHEASHVLQGDLGPGDLCDQLLKREVAGQAIPNDFLAWDAARLLAGIRDQEVGGYHVSLWVLTRLGIHDTGWLYEVIRTGKANGQSLLIGCEE